MQNSDAPDIINTPVIAAVNDVFWDDGNTKITDLLPKPVLVITSLINKNSEEEDLMKKILGACQLKEDDYNILLLAGEEKIAWHFLRDKLGVKSVVLFGVEPQQLGISVQFMLHQTNRFNNSNWVITSPLSQLLVQPDIKGHLWNYGLKPVFIDKIYG